MMNNRRIIVYSIIITLLGVALLAVSLAELVDSFWGGMGTGLIFVGALRFIRICRFYKDTEYREKVKTEISDERNAFIRIKAWSWAGYLFILIAAVAVIVLKVMGQELLSMAASAAVGLMLILYWGCYFILRKKY